MGMGMYKLMIVDDEENILKSLCRSLRAQPEWEIETYTSPTDALRRARTCIFDAVITDYNMPHMDGIEFLLGLRELQPDAIRILLTGMVNIDTLLSAINRAGAFRFIPKPWDDETLISSIQEGLRFRDVLMENRMLAQKVRDQQGELESFRRSLVSR